MSNNSPKRVAIDPDEYSAKHVGWTRDGRQFFLTRPFLPELGGSPGREFVALYLFDKVGRLLSAEIDDLGPRASIDPAQEQAVIARRLASLDAPSPKRISVRPFSVERFGTTFGLVPQEPESEDDEWAVEAQPGNYMAFFEPWDSGEYDT